jgi:biotin carboxylase
MSTPSHTGKTGFDDSITDAVHSANIVKEIGYPVVIKASDGETVPDEKKCHSHKGSAL